MNIEVIGWVATILLLVGYYLNAKRRISSWIVWMVGNSTMLVYSSLIQSWSVAFLSLALIILNIYGFCKWRDEK
jgi:hypothetical protein